MARLTKCDGCEITSAEKTRWLHLSREGQYGDPIAMFRGESEPADPILGRSGVVFHSYDCLRLWLMATDTERVAS